MIYHKSTLLRLFLFCPFFLLGQTPGIVFEPAIAPGNAVLDPNADGYVSATLSGFSASDLLESEIPYVPLAFAGNEPPSDPGPGPTCGFTDFVDSGNEDPAMVYYDGTNLLFRMRLGNAVPNAKGYSALIDTDQLFGLTGYNADPNATVDNPGFEIEVCLLTNFGVFVYNIDGTCPGPPSASFAGHTNYQKSVALTANCGDADYFYEFYIPFSALAALGITPLTPLRIAIASTMNPQPAICNGVISDFAGIDDNLCGSNAWECFTDIISNFPPTPTVDLNNGPGPDMSVCPMINGNLSAGATSVSGTSGHANGTLIKVFKNAALIGTATVISGAWTLSGISPALAVGDIITATATAPGNSESFSACNVTPVSAVCTVPLISGLVSGSVKAVCGSTGAGIPGAVVKIYNQYGAYVDNGLVITVEPDGSFLWKCNASTLNCSSGPNCLTDGAYYVTQTSGSECESDGIWICIGTSVTTPVPTINTPVYNTSTSISGTASPTAAVWVWSGNSVLGIVTADGLGIWTLSPVSLSIGQTLSAQAIVILQCASARSTPITVSGVITPPVITGSYCTAGILTSVT
ncbi:MAG TPA: hypothetical protein VI731_01635, partial [Bacteroidia bacterium]|nr:hypothetical protein [Bacteroidia bacterium]